MIFYHHSANYLPGYVSVNFFSPSVNVNICVFPALSILRLIICIDSYNIRSVTAVEEDFGLYICRYLKWSYHIQHINSTANVCAYQILRAFFTKNVWVLLKAFVTYVRPKLEYISPVWNPYLKKDVHSFESIQKKSVALCVFIAINRYFI